MTATAAALYLRVSKWDQDLENQRPELDKIAAQRSLSVVHVYEEKVSGVAAKRAEFSRMLHDAQRARFRVLLCWSIDRLGRNMFEIQRAANDLDRWGVRLVSAKETFLDVDDAFIRQLLLAQLAWVAEYERRRLIERTHAGLARARAKGIKLGRRPRYVDPDKLAALLAANVPIVHAARELGVSRTVLFEHLRAARSIATSPPDPRDPARLLGP